MTKYISTKKFTQPTGRFSLTLIALSVSIYLLMVLVTLPALQQMSGGMPIFDLMLSGYDFAHAQTLLGQLGDTGRAYYLQRQIPLDILYPAAFAMSFFTASCWLAKHYIQANRLLRALAFLPILVGLADYLENLLIVRMITTYPDLSESLVTMASSASIAKSSLTTFYFVAFLTMLALAGLSRVRRLKHST